eukprot:m.159164 g.159164  ORF g.159164 m.159164 type:complete len:552 (-) comp14521_c0_seq1:263-1918(-)
MIVQLPSVLLLGRSKVPADPAVFGALGRLLAMELAEQGLVDPGPLAPGVGGPERVDPRHRLAGERVAVERGRDERHGWDVLERERRHERRLLHRCLVPVRQGQRLRIVPPRDHPPGGVRVPVRVSPPRPPPRQRVDPAHGGQSPCLERPHNVLERQPEVHHPGGGPDGTKPWIEGQDDPGVEETGVGLILSVDRPRPAKEHAEPRGDVEARAATELQRSGAHGEEVAAPERGGRVHTPHPVEHPLSGDVGQKVEQAAPALGAGGHKLALPAGARVVLPPIASDFKGLRQAPPPRHLELDVHIPFPQREALDPEEAGGRGEHIRAVKEIEVELGVLVDPTILVLRPVRLGRRLSKPLQRLPGNLELGLHFRPCRTDLGVVARCRGRGQLVELLGQEKHPRPPRYHLVVVLEDRGTVVDADLDHQFPERRHRCPALPSRHAVEGAGPVLARGRRVEAGPSPTPISPPRLPWEARVERSPAEREEKKGHRHPDEDGARRRRSNRECHKPCEHRQHHWPFFNPHVFLFSSLTSTRHCRSSGHGVTAPLEWQTSVR